MFTKLCQYLALKGEEVKMKWRKLDEEEKWVLVKEQSFMESERWACVLPFHQSFIFVGM